MVTVTDDSALVDLMAMGWKVGPAEQGIYPIPNVWDDIIDSPHCEVLTDGSEVIELEGDAVEYL